jgi:hypothetical protein
LITDVDSVFIRVRGLLGGRLNRMPSTIRHEATFLKKVNQGGCFKLARECAAWLLRWLVFTDHQTSARTDLEVIVEMQVLRVNKKIKIDIMPRLANGSKSVLLEMFTRDLNPIGCRVIESVAESGAAHKYINGRSVQMV